MNPATLKQLMRVLPARELDNGNILTGPVRLSYPYLFEKAPGYKGGEQKYMATLLFPTGSDMSLLEEAVAHVAAEEWGSNWRKKHVNLPFRDGGEPRVAERAGYGPGVVWFRATTKNSPGVVDRKGRDLKPDDIYPGVWALVTVRPFAYGEGGDLGVSFGLQNVCKLADGERLGGGGSSAAEDFEAIRDLEDVDALLAAEEADDMAADVLG